MYKKKLRHNYVHRILKQTDRINALVWRACYTAVDFRASLGFSLTAASSYIHEAYVHPTNEKIRTSGILKQESRFIVRISLQLNYFCPSLFTKNVFLRSGQVPEEEKYHCSCGTEYKIVQEDQFPWGNEFAAL